MDTQYKRIKVTLLLAGIVLIILQILFCFVSLFINLDRMVSSTATSLLSSTNEELTANLNQRFEGLKTMADVVKKNKDCVSYDRISSSLSPADMAQTELTIGQTLASYSITNNFADCGIIYSDGSYLGLVDTATIDLFPNTSIYDVFADLGNSDNERFLTGQQNDYSHIYYALPLNTHSLFLVSILSVDLEPLFYNAEENYNLVLHLSTTDNRIIYSGDQEEEKSHTLNSDLAQTIESDDSLSMTIRDTVIASNTCINGWRVTSTIAESNLSAESHSLRTLYILISLLVIVASIVLVVLMLIQYKKSVGHLKMVEDNLEEFTDLNHLNIDN